MLNERAIEALILAAGQSSRMGRTKALLRWQGHTFLEHVARALAGPRMKISVVTGFDEAAVAAEARRLGLATVHNPNAVQGMMSSLQAGLRALAPTADAALIALVDQPALEPGVVMSLLGEFQSRRNQFSLARAVYANEPGHPCLIGREHFDEILAQPVSDRGAQFLFQRNPDQVLLLKFAAPTFADVDTPADLEGLLHAR